MKNIITGLHGIEETIKASKETGRVLVSRRNKRIENILSIAVASGYPVVDISPREMLNRFGDQNRGIVLELYTSSNNKKQKKENTSTPDNFFNAIDSLKKTNALVIILDGITDPHNYGAILRSAEQFGADLVVSRSRRSVSETDTIARTSAGAINFVNTSVVSNLSRAVDHLKKNNFWVYSAEMEGQTLFSTNLTGKVALVLGSEGKGVSRLLSEKCDASISIPSSGRLDSLNVSVAAGVMMYEVRRQQVGSC